MYVLWTCDNSKLLNWGIGFFLVLFTVLLVIIIALAVSLIAVAMRCSL
jgi:hypothetical protein